MTFSIIGAGNIAWFLGTRLTAGGHQCTGVYGRNHDAVNQLANALHCSPFYTISTVVDGSADICFLAISDAVISVGVAGLSLKETVLIHTAGAVALDAIKAAADHRAVLWPIYSIVKNNLPTYRNIPCAWEASTPKARQRVVEAGSAITDHLFEARYDQRKWIHLSAVFSNNFTNHLLAICEQLCVENNIPFTTLLPIIEQTMDRIRYASPKSLQTGPAARNDNTTINAQIAMLAGHPFWQDIYEDITLSIQSGIAK